MFEFPFQPKDKDPIYWSIELSQSWLTHNRNKELFLLIYLHCNIRLF
ncbi:hypothetical protein GARC_5092 [Paraglaciecola arctica BSs20135]|uniref:Uncharacterized protein n=1 Tax=Paraglaciecola arctica BSs20135 TaxID=493475 RepID=K6YV27_9ALTE|nr:hypothetical protein GARC_5092 [Paraglaciecola arctica BSs20135]